MEEIDYKRSFELLNRDVDACLEIIERWKKNCAYLVSIGVMPPDQWGVPLVEKLVPYERYDVVYHCNPATGDKILNRYILKNGFELYSIGFSCKSRNASVLYSYVIANSVRDAKERFSSMCNGAGEITTIPPSQTKGEHRAAKISEIIRDLQEIQEKYGDVGVYVNPWAEAVNRPVIAAKSSFVDEAGSIQAVIIA